MAVFVEHLSGEAGCSFEYDPDRLSAIAQDVEILVRIVGVAWCKQLYLGSPNSQSTEGDLTLPIRECLSVVPRFFVLPRYENVALCIPDRRSARRVEGLKVSRVAAFKS